MLTFVLDLKKGLLPQSTPDLVEENEDDQSEMEANGKDLKRRTSAQKIYFFVLFYLYFLLFIIFIFFF